MKRIEILVFTSFIVLCLLSMSTPQSQGFVTIDFPSNINVGPYIDTIDYRVIANQDQRVLALQAGTIQMDTSFFDPVHLPTLAEDTDIDIFSAYRNGYGHITINCRDYPLNISGLRRAFAFAFDKTRVTEQVLDGFSIEHDSLVPQSNGWCAEDQFEWHYYDARPDIGNQILDDLNFTIDTETGYRLAPDGSEFDIKFETASYYGALPNIAVDALTSLHIDARVVYSDFNEYINRLDNHGEYDMIYYAINFYDNDVDWLAYHYWSEYADVYGENPTNFANETYDSWRDQLLHGTTYEEVYEAAVEMQKILQYNVPRLVVYENTYMQAYRSDVFTGHVEDLLQYISGQWTMRKIHFIDGSFGGTVPVAISEEPDSFNFFVTNSAYSIHILRELWPSLYRYSPDVTPWPDLAEALVTETHSDNPEVPEGHTRFTIDIVHNATWSDGVPLTADDVAFTFAYILESAIYENPAASELGELLSVYSPSMYRVVFEFATESYWHFSAFAYSYIIPKHIFNDIDGIGYENWNVWNPVFDPLDPNVNCGPFVLTDYEAGEYYELSMNPLFHYTPDRTTTSTTTTTTTVTSTTTTTTTSTSTTTTSNTSNSTTNTNEGQPLNLSQVISYALISASGIVIIFCVVLIVRSKGD